MASNIFKWPCQLKMTGFSRAVWWGPIIQGKFISFFEQFIFSRFRPTLSPFRPPIFCGFRPSIFNRFRQFILGQIRRSTLGRSDPPFSADSGRTFQTFHFLFNRRLSPRPGTLSKVLENGHCKPEVGINEHEHPCIVITDPTWPTYFDPT